MIVKQVTLKGINYEKELEKNVELRKENENLKEQLKEHEKATYCYKTIINSLETIRAILNGTFNENDYDEW